MSHTETELLIDGVCDLHIHAAPDVKGRTVDELGLSRRAKDAGYKAVLFKSNVWSCHDRAYLVRQALPGFGCYGSLVMNLAFGDKVNVYAVEQALKTSGSLCRCVWMPTQNAAYPSTAETGHTGKTIPVVDVSGNVLPEVIQVMELCAEADIIFATGHSSPEESLAMARKAKEIGMRKFVITHANSRIWRLTHDQIRQAVDLGAWIEYCYLPRLWGPGTGLPNMERQTTEEFTGYVRLVPERSFVSTDLGSAGMPDPIAGKEAGHEVYRFDCAQRKVSPCIACNRCGMNGTCIFNDDFEELRPHLVDADMVVFATPMYYFGFSSQLKTVIDRFYALNGQIKGAPKQAAFLMAYANTDPKEAEPMASHYHTLLRYLGWKDCGMVVSPGMWPAGAVNGTQYSRKAYELGRNL